MSIAQQLKSYFPEPSNAININIEKSSGLAMFAAGLKDSINGSQEFGVFKLTGDAHRVSQIEMPQPGYIDTWKGRDLLHLLQSFQRFDLDDHNVFPVGFFQCFKWIPRDIIIMGQVQSQSRFPERTLAGHHSAILEASSTDDTEGTMIPLVPASSIGAIRW